MGRRPNTRNTNKRLKLEEENVQGATLEVYRRINTTGLVRADDVNQLYMIWKPICQGCRVNTKDNPNCFCGLIPPPNGSRKSGLWQKLSEIILSLGVDPSMDLRSSPDTPAGLTNLGATCYANSILQCLYMNKSFREGVFSVEPDILKKQPVLDQLARLFAKLHASKMSFIDSAPFIKTLELDKGVQQDSHEFLTLLLHLLEHCLSCSQNSKAKTVVQYLFRGSVSHVTTCSRCGRDSDASSKMEDFYELELNIKDLNSLDESLDDYLAVEELEGDNQYYCESCATRVDARRSIKLRSLPPVLNFQLKRCVFLPKTTTKKKITSAICFPEVLDMRNRLHEHSQLEAIYDLSAVLIHKGSAVNSGHYVANIKDESTGIWWEFDDEEVSRLGQHPFGQSSSKAAAKSVQTEPNGAVTENVIACQPISSESNELNLHQTFSSSDAYMLMYTLRHAKNGDVSCAIIRENNNGVVLESGISLPDHLSQEINELNSSYLRASEEYKAKKESKSKDVKERREEVRSVLSEAPSRSPEEPYFWISTEWLRHWADDICPPIIDNSSIQCLHGKVPASKIGHMKRLSANAWTMLLSKHGGGPVLANNDYCSDCLIHEASTMVSADSYRDRRTSMKEVAEEAFAGKYFEGPLYFVSKAWLQQWLRRKNIDSPCEADVGPTASIRCRHGELKPEQAGGAKRVLVPEDLWLFFYNTSNLVKPDDFLACSTFPSDSAPCAQCSVELTEFASLEDNLREFKLKQRQNHEKLAMGKGIALSPHQRYYLLPTFWLSNWRGYVTSSGKAAASFSKPETLTSVIDSLICEKHSRLLHRPSPLIWKRGMIMQRLSNTDVLTIITEDDWRLFCEDFDGTEAKGIGAEIEVSNCMGDNSVGYSAETPISITALEEANAESDLKRFAVKTCPEVCEVCVGERESCELIKKLNYCNEDICVCFVRGKDPPRSVLEAAAKFSEPDRRASKRSRKTPFGNSTNLNVSGSTSMYQLKMMIWESFGIVKENQVLRKGSQVIDGESATLSEMNIFAGDTLWVTDSEIHEDRDIADELADQKMEVQQAEGGFRGTLLSSNISTQVV